jgi:hypothetical protein
MRARRDAVVAASFAALALAPHAARAQQPTPAEALGAVRGVVYDSLTRRPLAGATVQSVRAADLAWGRTAAADSSGAFRIDSLPPGRYFVGFSHPLLDLLRVEAMPRLVELGADGDALRVDLGVPDLARVRAIVCGSTQESTDSSGLVAGRVRDVADGAPVANAKVILTWSEVVLRSDGVRTEPHRVPVSTGPDGRYAVCGVPTGEELVATAEAPGRATGQVALEVPPRGFVVRDLTLGDTAVVVTDAPSASRKRGARGKARDTTVARVARGTARLTGTVRDPAGRPVRGGKAFVWGTAATTAVGGDGTFTLGELPEGTRTLEVRAIGFTMRRVVVDLAAGRAATVDVRMEPTVPLLNPVTVFGTPAKPSARVAEFLQRRRFRTFGRFILGEEIARRRDFDVTDALRGIAGIQLEPNGRLGKTILGRSALGGWCKALVILDGMPLEPTDDIDHWVGAQQVAGIEVYPDDAYAPPEYGLGHRNFCSVVLVWTK